MATELNSARSALLNEGKGGSGGGHLGTDGPKRGKKVQKECGQEQLIYVVLTLNPGF